jgi:hypothetical protein
MHKELITYVVWIFAIVLVLCGLLAQVGVDAHHWMPRNWRASKKLEKKDGAEGSSEAVGGEDASHRTEVPQPNLSSE